MDWFEDVILTHAAVIGLSAGYQPATQQDTARMAEEQRAQFLRRESQPYQSPAQSLNGLSAACRCQCYCKGWGQ